MSFFPLKPKTLCVIFVVNVEDMEAIEKELKFFETNQIKLKNFEEKTRVLQGHAKKLVTQNHFDSAFISKQVEEILEYQEKVLDLTKGREMTCSEACLVLDTLVLLAYKERTHTFMIIIV